MLRQRGRVTGTAGLHKQDDGKGEESKKYRQPGTQSNTTEKEVLPLRLKTPSQPLVFCFSGVSPLCGAVEKLYDIYPDARASLCFYRGCYFLAVYSSLAMRGKVRSLLYEYGKFLGPSGVLYSFCEEHGMPITHNAVTELGAALRSD